MNRALMVWELSNDHTLCLVDKGLRVLCFSPSYPEGDPMRYRIMEVQFVKRCHEITHFAIINSPEGRIA